MKSFEINTIYTANDFLRFNLAYYRNSLKKKFSKENVSESYRWINKGTVTTNGFEFVADFRIENFKSYFNYTYNLSVDDFDVVIPEIAKHNINAGIKIGISDHIKFGLRSNYLGKRTNPKTISATGNDIIDPALIFHSTLSYIDFYGFNFNLIVKNLTNKEYYHTSNRPPDRYRQPQRSVILKCSYSLK